jgi:hypothetical protein
MSPAITEAFCVSAVGAMLTDRWPVGSLTRESFPAFARYVERFCPEVRRRVSKSRKKKRK